MPDKPAREQAELLQGILDLLILRTVEVAPLHGWGISKSIRRMSHDVLTVNQGSLYPIVWKPPASSKANGARHLKDATRSSIRSHVLERNASRTRTITGCCFLAPSTTY
jgi:Transcriptional regulator PadR-like family